MKKLCVLVLAGLFCIAPVHSACGSEIRKTPKASDHKTPYVSASFVELERAPISVDYEVPLESAVTQGHYEKYDHTWENNRSPRVARKGRADLTVRLYYLEKEMTFGNILDEMDKMNLRAAEPLELLAFGSRYPS